MCGQSAQTIVYVDGFNLYYGVLKHSAHKWLDLQRLFELLRPDDDIQAIKYFTSLVEPGPHRDRQAVLLRALRTLPLVQPIFGLFKRKKITCRCPGCTQPAGDRPIFHTLPPALLQVAQMPAQIPDGAGGVIQKPAAW